MANLFKFEPRICRRGSETI